MKRILLIFSVFLPCLVSAQNNDLYRDWARFDYYDAANQQITVNPSVVFMGDSIFDGWDDCQPEYFTGNNFACRAIGGQVTAQMLVRLRADVLDLKPKAVVILAGTNDLALNNGYIKPEHIVENVVSMVELARMAGIRPILCSVLPAGDYPWRPEVEDVPGKIAELNSMLKEYADAEKVTWVDLHAQMVASDGSMTAAYTYDGVHPTADGYNVMQQTLYPFLKKYIKK